jgi:hypothetical protein
MWFQVAFSMPRLRGKSKRGTTCYDAKGRGTRWHGQWDRLSSPQDPKCVSTLEPLITHIPSLTSDFPPWATTPVLPPLLSPYAFRGKWVTSHGKSLNFTPSFIMFPTRQPPPPPPISATSPVPSSPLSSLSSPIPSSDCPTSSSDSRPPPLASFPCSLYVGR